MIKSIPITANRIQARRISARRITAGQGLYPSDLTCLIKNGKLNPAASFIRTGDVQLESGTVFGPNEYPRYQGSGVHHGQETNKCLCDGSPTIYLDGVSIAGGTITDLSIVDTDGGKYYKATPGPSGFIKIAGLALANTINSASIEIYTEAGGMYEFYSSLPRGTDGATGNSTSPEVLSFEGFSPTVSGTPTDRELFLYISGAPVYFRFPQLIECGYTIGPLRIPSSRLSTVSIDTAASDLSTLHGLTASITDPKASFIWDILDGLPDGDELIDSSLPPVPRAGNSVSNTGLPYTITLDSGTTLGADYTLLSMPVGGERYISSGSFDPLSGATSVGINPVPSFPAGTTDIVSRYTVTADQTYAIVSFGRNVGDDITFRSISFMALLPAIGTLTFKNLSIRPTTAQWQTVGTQMILMAQEDGTPIFWIDKADGKYKISDGTNTAETLQAYTAGQNHTVSIVLGGDKMQLVMDGVNGPVAPFTGTLIDGTNTLKFNYLNEDIVEVEDICGSPTATFTEALHLAQELAHTL